MDIEQGVYPGLSWDIAPEEKDEKIALPAAEVEVAGNTYQMAAASFDPEDGSVYLTPDGYAFVPADQDTTNLTKFPNHENYWVCSIRVGEDGKNDITILKAVKSE